MSCPDPKVNDEDLMCDVGPSLFSNSIADEGLSANRLLHTSCCAGTQKSHNARHDSGRAYDHQVTCRAAYIKALSSTTASTFLSHTPLSKDAKQRSESNMSRLSRRTGVDSCVALPEEEHPYHRQVGWSIVSQNKACIFVI